MMGRVTSEDLLKAVKDAETKAPGAFQAVADLAKAELGANNEDRQRILIREQNELQRAHDLAMKPGTAVGHGQYN